MENPAAKPQEGTPGDNTALKELIKKAVSQEKSLKTKEEKIEMAKVLLQVFEKNKSVQEAMGISDKEIAFIYFYAYKLFNAGQNKEALEVFKILFKLKPTAEYATAVGACYHKLKDYNSAATLYMAALQLNPMDPVPPFYCYDCFMNMNNIYGAFAVLSHAMHAARQNNKYKSIEEKASLLLKGLNERISEDLEKNGEKKPA